MREEVCPRCKGTGIINKRTIKRPIWCHRRQLGNHTICCVCNKKANYQEGDGKYLHSLCKQHQHYAKVEDQNTTNNAEVKE